jgi:hypothetical protein
LANAVRIVSVTPPPTYSWAAAKSASETSTVILRISPMPVGMPYWKLVFKLVLDYGGRFVF